MVFNRVTSGNRKNRTLRVGGGWNPTIEGWNAHAEILGHVMREHALGQQLLSWLNLSVGH